MNSISAASCGISRRPKVTYYYYTLLSREMYREFFLLFLICSLDIDLHHVRLVPGMFTVIFSFVFFVVLIEAVSLTVLSP